MNVHEELIKRFRGQVVTFLGLGLNHQALATAFLEADLSFTVRERDAEAVARFKASVPQFEQSFDALVHVEIVPDILKGLAHKDRIYFRSPGIPADKPALRAAVKAGSMVTTQTALFFELCPAKIIGVTGTKGKGTTSTLITRILQAGYDQGNVYLGGNIGTDPFSFLAEVEADDLVVLELSSFQLEDLPQSPNVAVVLHVTQDHLDHHRTIGDYHAAKQHILAHQKKSDVAVISGDYPADMQQYLAAAKGEVLQYWRHQPGRNGAWVDTQANDEILFYQVGEQLDSFSIHGRQLLGEHNLENILAAVLVGAHFNMPAWAMQRVVLAFTGLPHRLTKIDKVSIAAYDDSFATIPESAGVSLEVFAGKRVHLLAGGKDKGQNYRALAPLIVQHCASLSLLPGVATPDLERAVRTACKKMPRAHIEILKPAKKNLGDGPALYRDLLAQVQKHWQEGDILLLAPSAASDPPFPNYKVRGNQFVDVVQELYA